jgi:transposase-like protein
MRYPASEKLEIIRIVEQSHLSARNTLKQLGIPCRTFYRWYARYVQGGPEALADRPSAPSRVWNRIPASVHHQIIELNWSNLISAPATWRGASPTRNNTSFRKPRFTGFSRPPTSSSTRRPVPTRCGRPTSPTSRSSAEQAAYGHDIGYKE